MYNNYDDLEKLVNRFFEADELEKSRILEEIIDSFKPLLIKLMMKYFKKYDEDIYQSSVVELIERTMDYDYKNYNKFAGYIKKFMEYYFRREYFKYIEEKNITYEQLYDDDLSQKDIYDVEIVSVFENLNTNQKYIVKKNIIENQKLKQVAIDMNISYIHAKKIKKEAIENMKLSLKV